MPSVQEQAFEAAKQYVGKPLKELQDACLKAGWIVRVTSEDGKRYLGTCDFRNNRINVAVVAGLVTVIGGVG